MHDEMRVSGGRKTLKKLMIDRKIPLNRRGLLPVAEDEQGILGVYGIGVNLIVPLPLVTARASLE